MVCLAQVRATWIVVEQERPGSRREESTFMQELRGTICHPLGAILLS